MNVWGGGDQELGGGDEKLEHEIADDDRTSHSTFINCKQLAGSLTARTAREISNCRPVFLITGRCSGLGIALCSLNSDFF